MSPLGANGLLLIRVLQSQKIVLVLMLMFPNVDRI